MSPSPSLGAERAAVQAPLVRYATEIGWAYLPPEEALTLRRGEGGRSATRPSGRS